MVHYFLPTKDVIQRRANRVNPYRHYHDHDFLLVKSCRYFAGLTTRKYLFTAINVIVWIDTNPKVTDMKPWNWHISSPKGHWQVIPESGDKMLAKIPTLKSVIASDHTNMLGTVRIGRFKTRTNRVIKFPKSNADKSSAQTHNSSTIISVLFELTNFNLSASWASLRSHLLCVATWLCLLKRRGTLYSNKFPLTLIGACENRIWTLFTCAIEVILIHKRGYRDIVAGK